MNKGKALRLGDTLALTAPASPLPQEELAQVSSVVQKLGFKVKLGSSCYKTYGGYLAGPPKERAQELNDLFADPSIAAILCLRGGYGSPQLLPWLDYELIAAHPKLFIGYSDITALHIALLQKAKLATVHGPMAATDLARGLNDHSFNYFWRTLTERKPLGIIANPPGEELGCLVEGLASGPIVGGNLAVISATLGTAYELDSKGKLLFLEDIGEEPYKLDRMFTQLALAGKFADAAGIILGTWTKCASSKYPQSFSVVDLAAQIIAPFGKPTMYNLQAGHGPVNLTLPLGVQATLNASQKTLVIEESIVL